MIPARLIPVRHITTALGSGTDTPATVTPEAVPNENVADVIVVSAVIPAPVMVKVADWLRNGLCGPFPLIELLTAL